MSKKSLSLFVLTVLSFIFLFFCLNLKSEAAFSAGTRTVTFYDSDQETVIYQFQVEAVTESPTFASLFVTGGPISVSDIRRIKDGYEIIQYNRLDTGDKIAPTSFPSLTKKVTKNIDFVAIYDTNPVKYPINYVLNGGSNPASAPTYFTVTEAVTLPTPTKANCNFDGWYTDSTLTTKASEPAIPLGSCINEYEEDGSYPSLTFYAKWIDLTPAKPVISKISNPSSGKATLTLTSIVSADGLQVQFTTDKNFKKNIHTITTSSSLKFSATGLAKGKTYYFRVRAYKVDSTGNNVYSAYSTKKSVKITKGETEYNPTSTSATLKNVKISGKNLSVTATLKKRLKSYDDFYYLVKVDPNTDKYLGVVAQTEKTSKLTFTLPAIDSKGTNLIMGKYAIAVKSTSKSYKIISKAAYVSNPETYASYKASYPTSSSKKGRQGVYDTSVGDKQYFNNLCINEIIATKSTGEAFKYNGKTYYFKTTWLDEVIKTVNSSGGTVTIQLMLKYDSSTKNLIKSTARANLDKNYYAFNIEDTAARNQIEAAFFWLAKHWSQTNCHVDNWILGNEVNTYLNTIGWYWAGSISHDAFIKNYAQTFRILYYAVKSNYKNARVFTCVDHTFSDRDYDWGSKNFMVSFNSAIKSMNKNISWNLAYHAYSAVLTNADFWNDNTSSLYKVDSTYNSDFVSPLNLDVLTNYVKEKFGKNVHIILSEQAFSSTGGTNSAVNGGRAAGEDVQAAAIAYLFYKAMFNSSIDAVIYSHSSDDLGAGMDFSMKNAAKDVYKYMDTPSYASHTTSCLGTIGRTSSTRPSSLSWSALISNFSDATLKKMASR